MNRNQDPHKPPAQGSEPPVTPARAGRRELVELRRRLSEIDAETCPVRRARLVRHLAQRGALVDALGDAIGITDRRVRIEEARAAR